jgi:hypothetical protein
MLRLRRGDQADRDRARAAELDFGGWAKCSVPATGLGEPVVGTLAALVGIIVVVVRMPVMAPAICVSAHVTSMPLGPLYPGEFLLRFRDA